MRVGRRDTPQAAGSVRTAASTLGWVLLVTGGLASAVLLVLREVTVLHTWNLFLIVAATFIPLLWIPALVACLGMVLVLRARWRALGAVVLVATMAVFAWPLLPGQERSHTPLTVGPPLTVLSLNLQFGLADVEELSELVTSEVDVLALQEFTPAFEEELVRTLRGVTQQRPQLDRLQNDLVAYMRERGASWETIGAGLGVARQSAWEKFRHVEGS